MEILIFSYHFTVISIIIVTTLATLGSMGRIGIFKNVDASYTKLLVGALLVEMAAAFFGVYRTLPELRLDVSEKYKFEIQYNDLAQGFLSSLKNEDRRLVEYFVNNGQLAEFYDFKSVVEDYERVNDLARIGGTNWLDYYQKLLSKRQQGYVALYDEVFYKEPFVVEKAERLMLRYARIINSSNKTGQGEMWASVSKDKMEGIVVYEFPGDTVPTVLKFTGSRVSNGEGNNKDKMKLSFTQSASAFSTNAGIFLRPSGAFKVELDKTGDAYMGDFFSFGEVRIELWEM
ncbi:hypothetical protein CWC22_010890 [Pseudoalteromonas rubra]|uniref:Uncharacterized protein n=1 Tax=Pseudoalteromonas rubra TaxID=43658 RepID=A0A5S3UPW6_9GAMM|nr:hypothetical protein [Pseudoalteromonas rubra]QPB83465.1 hypothetical protein CWC22_010890 [Pseudoalteromonas rubra]